MNPQKKRILLADAAKDLITSLLHAHAAKNYLFEICYTGTECLKKIDSFQPDLVILDLWLPELHGIEVLKKIRANPKFSTVGVILTSAHAMIQNYHAAVQSGVNYFLEKPFEIDAFFSLIETFFKEGLKPAPFGGKESKEHPGQHCYVPQPHSPNSYMKFWGTRGSNPVSGPEYVRFGGNTSCLEIKHGHDLVIIDAGTGIRPLGNMMVPASAKTIHLLIGHTHWDHITGFPFFSPLYNPDCNVCIWSPIGFGKTTQELFTEMLAYSYFPVRIDDIQAKLTFKDIHEADPFSIGDVWIDTHYACHPGATLCFKIRIGGKTYGYATDNEMFMGYHGHPNSLASKHPLIASHQSLIHFFKDCDVLIHEAQYTPQEYQEKVGWGHSSISNAAILLKYCGVKEWIVTHHDPKHTDEDLFKKVQLHHDIIEDCKIHCHVHMAYDGFVLPL
jgi:CheY-like chemotaxis protein